ncbi:MAG: Uma2 family endonuclease [Chloroflexota bacterium]
MLETPPKTSPELSIESVQRLSINQYHAMVDAGIFSPADQVELLQGWVIKKMPKKPSHNAITGIIFDFILALLPVGWFVDMEGPISTSDSEPEPNIAVIKGKRIDYIERHPNGEEVGIVIEIADSSLLRDQTTKRLIYAAANIPTYWVVNLRDQQIELYSNPINGNNPDYGSKQTFQFDQACPIHIDEKKIGDLTLSEHLNQYPTE